MSDKTYRDAPEGAMEAIPTGWRALGYGDEVEGFDLERDQGALGYWSRSDDAFHRRSRDGGPLHRDDFYIIKIGSSLDLANRRPPIKPERHDRDLQSFDTGAVRDVQGDKGLPSLRPVHALNRLDRHMQRGAQKYAARNWEQGIPLSRFADSALRHLDKALAGYDDEDHLAAALWNVACLVDTQERIRARLLPDELDDLPVTFAGKTPNF